MIKMQDHKFNHFEKRHEAWLNELYNTFPHVLKSGKIEASEISTLSKRMSMLDSKYPAPSMFYTDVNRWRVRRGLYKLPDLDACREMFGVNISNSTVDKKEPTKISNLPAMITIEDHIKNVSMGIDVDNDQMEYIPKSMKEYHKTSVSDHIERVISTNRFYPLYLYGPTGTGKTTTVLQACANLGRGVFRVNITPETDESDLLGSMVLRSNEDGGGTDYEYGPVVHAMKTGSVLLLDELDLGTPRIMCLQPILEGGAVYIKKTKEMIYPKPGFTVIATGNTKGSGNESSGNYVGTQYLNEAFMDRFSLWIDFDYVAPSEENKILEKYWKEISSYDTPKEFIKSLIEWANTIRKANKDGEVDSTVSTRRIKNVLDHTNIFFEETYTSNVQCIINRFNSDVSSAFMKYWSLVDSNDRYATRTLQKDLQMGDINNSTEKKCDTWSNPYN